MTPTRLIRSNNDKILAGVCGGLATYTNIDPILVRLAFFLLIVASGIGIPIYLLLWIMMPNEENIDATSNAIVQQNIRDMVPTAMNSLKQIGNSQAISTVIILCGCYFLFTQFGWLKWLSSGTFWSLIIIGLGLYMLKQR